MAHLVRRDYLNENYDFSAMLRDNLSIVGVVVAKWSPSELQNMFLEFNGVVETSFVGTRQPLETIHFWELEESVVVKRLIYFSKVFPIKIHIFGSWVRPDGLSKSTIGRYHKFWWSLLRAYYINLAPLGGPNRSVEVDEALFAKRKNNQGRLVPEIWVLGIRERK